MTHIILDDGNGAPVIDLQVVRYERDQKRAKLRCEHPRVIIDVRKNTLTCQDCDAEVSAVWYLSHWIVEHWARFESQRKGAEATIAEASKRVRTKCDHCGEMTRIRGL